MEEVSPPKRKTWKASSPNKEGMYSFLPQKILAGKLPHTNNISSSKILHLPKIVRGPKRVAMAPHGLKIRANDAQRPQETVLKIGSGQKTVEQHTTKNDFQNQNILFNFIIFWFSSEFSSSLV